ncbi:MAG: hypothetical protein QXL47_03150 [Candidatus Anstonellales archaeon]
MGSEIEERIKQLEEEKKALIEEIKTLNNRLRYKTMEHKALLPFVEKTKDVRVDNLMKQLKGLEFKVATQAHTPQMERAIVKKIMELEKELSKYKSVFRARKKLKLVENDLNEIKVKTDEVEKKLKTIRKELKGLYEKLKMKKAAEKKGMMYGEKTDHMITLEDVVVIENEGKNNGKKKKV